MQQRAAADRHFSACGKRGSCPTRAVRRQPRLPKSARDCLGLRRPRGSDASCVPQLVVPTPPTLLPPCRLAAGVSLRFGDPLRESPPRRAPLGPGPTCPVPRFIASPSCRLARSSLSVPSGSAGPSSPLAGPVSPPAPPRSDLLRLPVQDVLRRPVQTSPPHRTALLRRPEQVSFVALYGPSPSV